MGMRRPMTAALVMGLGSSILMAAPFTPGNIVISQIGDGDTPSTDNASPVHLLEISVGDPDGTIVQDLALPTVTSVPNHRFALTSYARDGHLKRSSNGLFLTIGGYDASIDPLDPSYPAPNEAPSESVPRVIARIDPFGIVDTATAVTDAYGVPASTTGIHCVVSTDGRHFWTAGRSASGSTERVRYIVYKATTSQILNGTSQPRSVVIFNDELYATYNISGRRGIHQIGTGLPTTSGQATTFIEYATIQCPDGATYPCAPFAGQSGSPYDHYWHDENTVYITDDRHPEANGGILKFERDLDSQSATFGKMLFRCLFNVGLRPQAQALKTMAARPDGQGNLEIFAITAEEQSGSFQNRLMRLVDTGCPGGGWQPGGTILPCPESFTTLQTSPGGTDFRGVALAPRACEGAECIGQCCLNEGCQDTTLAECQGLNGLWRGLGTSCATETCPLVCPTPYADTDGDDDVDLDDFGDFQSCYAGANVVVEGACRCFDRPEEGFPAGDGDVDSTDFAAFQACAGGPNLPPANCD